MFDTISIFTHHYTSLQVALGRVKERLYLDEDEDDHLDPDINSVKVIGRRMPDPEYDVTLPFGTYSELMYKLVVFTVARVIGI